MKVLKSIFLGFSVSIIFLMLLCIFTFILLFPVHMYLNYGILIGFITALILWTFVFALAFYIEEYTD